MLNRSFSFRKSSRAVTLAAVAGLFVGASGLATGPAKADDTNNKYLAACAHLKDGSAEHAGCLVGQIERQTADLKKDTTRLKAERSAAKKEIKAIGESDSCFDFLTKGRDAKKFTREAVIEAAGGKLTVENTCAVARKFGFGQRASADAPRLQ